MARKAARLRRSLKPHEYLVYRGRDGRTKKFRSDVNLTIEVWSKKTGKQVLDKKHRKLVLNFVDKKTAKPKPQKFSKLQTKILSRKEVSSKTRDALDTFVFKLHSRDFILNQIPPGAVVWLNDHVEAQSEVVLTIRLDFPDDTFRISNGIFVSQKWSYKDFVRWLAVLIADMYRANGVRFSPKKHARNDREKRRRQMRSMKVTLSVYTIESWMRGAY